MSKKESSTPFGLKMGTSASKPIIISDETGSKIPKSIMEFPRSEMLPPYLVP